MRALVFALVVCSPLPALEIHPHLLGSPERDRLMDQYALVHYGMAEARLVDPRLIVIHCTETRDLKETLALFAPLTLGNSRPELGDHGAVNVGIHFVVDQDGTVYQLASLDRMSRHIIGFNHTAVGIENVAPTEARLTEAQLEADAALVAYLKKMLPSLVFLIGHFEYAFLDRPHQQLWQEVQPDYGRTKKKDPGPSFMANLRGLLKTRYAMSLQE